VSNQSGGALATPADRTRGILANIGDQLNNRSAFLADMLPPQITPARLRAFSLLAMGRAPALQQCSVESLLGAVYECAQAALEPNGTDCCIVPYRGEAQMQLMFRGCMKLARRSGSVQAIWADVVRARDVFDEVRGSDLRLVHAIPKDEDGVPVLEEHRGERIAAYACARFSDGFVQPRVVYVDEVERAMRSSKTANRADSPWKLHTDEMWKKTALKRLCKLLPIDDALQRAVSLDDMADAGISQGLGDQWKAAPTDKGATVTDARVKEDEEPLTF